MPDHLDVPLERRRDEPDPVAVGFVLELGRALHRAGHPAQRLEDMLGAISDRLGLFNHQFFSTPTSIMASFGPLGRQRTHMLRVTPGEVNLGTLAALEQVALEVAQGRMSPVEGVVAIDRITSAPSLYGAGLTTVAYGVVSGAATQFLGGGVHEVAVATLLGLALGVLALGTRGRPRLGRVFEPVAAFVVSAGALGLARAIAPLSVLIATLGGLIVLLPGLTLTVAMSELATRNLASGTARISGAFMTFLAIAFGVALGNRVGGAVFGVLPAAASAPLPAWSAYVAVVAAGLGFVVVLRAEPRDAFWIVAIGALGVIGGRAGAATMGVELGTFAGALAVGLAGSAYERLKRRPAAVVSVPGILLLVPGSVGFRGLTSLIERQAVAGIETIFSMILTVVALVAGLLIAAAVIPERRMSLGDPYHE
ncbi:MAG TPA: threonine/serine exporter family protein [Gemmatimonadales bacterium]|nr:threonine/serine exporter family protein [Gemmatimonadales bacterium]